MAGSFHDYDGDGDITEGVYFELDSLRSQLLGAIQDYAANVAGTAIAYDGQRYPYYFVDADGDGLASPGEASFGNRYRSWTPRLLKAAYNYQYAQKDPGAFAHNAKYVMELLHDSLEDLGQAVSVDLSATTRNDSGHFDPTAEPWRHFDEDGAVKAECARCHAPPSGLAIFLETGANPTEDQPLSYGMSCETCHVGTDFGTDPPRKQVATVTFPGGKTITNPGGDDSFLCMTCHQGRVGKADIDAAIAGGGSLSFMNVHYLAAGGSLYGTEAQVAYEYPGKSYAGKFGHVGPETAECVYCHEVKADRHSFLPTLRDECRLCHQESTPGDITTVRLARGDDYDGDGNTTERLKDEVAALSSALYAEIQAAAATDGNPIVFDPVTYPYFFHDTNGNGVAEPSEVSFGNRYTAWTPKLLKAAHNYQMSQKEPGNWAHNTQYTVQVIIDSIEDLGGDVSTYSRP